MASDGALRAAIAGREARAQFGLTAKFDESTFTSADWAALSGAWETLGADANAATSNGPDGLIDDDVAFVRPWGFDVSQIDAPALLVHGGEDRMVPSTHAHWLTEHCRQPELWLRPHDGHISILDAVPLAMGWLTTHAS
jgi:pimeloyl-ACP methyl ester carboxylesterase